MQLFLILTLHLRSYMYLDFSEIIMCHKMEVTRDLSDIILRLDLSFIVIFIIFNYLSCVIYLIVLTRYLSDIIIRL